MQRKKKVDIKEDRKCYRDQNYEKGREEEGETPCSCIANNIGWRFIFSGNEILVVSSRPRKKPINPFKQERLSMFIFCGSLNVSQLCRV